MRTYCEPWPGNRKTAPGGLESSFRPASFFGSALRLAASAAEAATRYLR